MKKRPLSISIIATGYLFAPLINILQIAWFNHWPLTGPRSVVHHLSPYEWSILACFPVIALGIYRVTRWGYLLFLAFSAFLLMHNSYAYLINPSYNLSVVIMFQLLIVGVAGFFLQRHMAAPYFNPQMKWWERDPRYPVSLSAQLHSRKRDIKVSVQDISKGGCFVCTDLKLNLGETVDLTINLTDISFKGIAKVVWVARRKPQGYGMMFIDQLSENKRALQTLLNALKHSQVPARPEKRRGFHHSA
jgi:Tfp pilus assembly protein PilZ